MTSRKVCPNCRFSNVAQASFCGDCGRPFASPSSQPPVNMQTGTNREVATSTPPNLRALENVATDLDKLWDDFYQIRQHKKKGGLLWDYLLKHIAAHELDVKIDEVKSRIEDMWLDGYEKSHNLPIQRILALQAQQIAHEREQHELQQEQQLAQQRFDFAQRQRDEALQRELRRHKAAQATVKEMADVEMVGRVERFDKVIKKIEDLLLTKGPLASQDAQSQDMKREMIFELVNLTKDIIFDKGSKETDYASYLDELDDLVDP